MLDDFSHHESKDVTSCEVIMERKKESLFVERLKCERDLIENRDVRKCINCIENCIIRQVSPLLSLRLLCLLSITQDGLSSRDSRDLIKLFTQSFGHEHISTFHNLKKLGLFVEHSHQTAINTSGSESSPSPGIPGAKYHASQSLGAKTSSSSSLPYFFTSKSKYKTIVKKLNLIPVLKEKESYDVRSPSDAAFVYGGSYIPIICPLLDLFLNKNSNQSNFDEILKVLPGVRCSSSLGQKFCIKNSNNHVSAANNPTSASPKVILIYFVGGVTFAEISALRFVAQKKSIKIMIATTGIMNGNQLMKQMMPIKFR